MRTCCQYNYAYIGTPIYLRKFLSAITEKYGNLVYTLLDLVSLSLKQVLGGAHFNNQPDPNKEIQVVIQ